MEDSPYLYTGAGAAHEVSDTGSQGSRRSFYGACGYSKEYFRNLAGDSGLYLRPSPGASPSRSHLLHPGTGQASGSPASEASKSPQRSPRSQPRLGPGSQYGFRSFQNPIGTVYHDPDTGTEWSWAGAGARADTETQGSGAGAGDTEAQTPSSGAGAGRSLLPYETLSGANYPGYYGYYVSPHGRSPPVYTSARAPAAQVTSDWSPSLSLLTSDWSTGHQPRPLPAAASALAIPRRPLPQHWLQCRTQPPSGAQVR